VEPRPTERLPRTLGEYEVARLIAKGGMGAVFEVVSPKTGAHYAAKIVLKGSDEHARARFQREAQLMARCDRHPGVVKVHAVGEDPQGGLFLILDLVEGEGLDVLLARERMLAPERAARLVRDVAAALGFAHEQGIVHRDVKPSNVLLDAGNGGAPRVTDFGLATARDVERLTRTGQFLGTMQYSAPEQVAATACGPETDVFALGCLLFRALAGETPFAGQDTLATIARIASEHPAPDVRSRARNVPEPLARIVARALAKDRARRYPNGTALAAELDRFLAGERVLTKAPAREIALRRVLVGLAFAALTLVAGLLLLLAQRNAAASHALDEGCDALARATHSLARARESAAPVTSASEAAVAEALAAATLARERFEDARARGSGEAAARATAAEALLGEIDLVAGEQELLSGRAAATLARLDRAPEKSVEARFLHARALLALGRTTDAKDEAEAALSDAGERSPDRLEAGADVLLGAGEAARAAKLYTRVLEIGTRRTTLVQAKRGGAAARAGDERQALEDLRTLVPEPKRLSDSRVANERLVPLAPVLYRRGLAAPTDAARARDLDAAWQIADPPPELAVPVGLCWTAEMASVQALSGSFLSAAPGPEEIKLLTRALERGRRAALVAPEATLEARYSALTAFRFWWDNHPDGEIRSMVTRAFLGAWPEDPTILLYAGRDRLQQGGDPGGALELLDKAVDGLPESRLPGVVLVARAIAATLLQTLPATLTLDLDRAERAARIGNDGNMLVLVSLRASEVSRRDMARRTLEEARTCDNMKEPGDIAGLESYWRTLIDRAPTDAEALALARAFDASLHSAASLESLADELAKARRWDEAANTVLARPGANPASLEIALRSLELVGRTAEAREVRSRIDAVPPKDPKGPR
jgi:serine/threonine-protein kinase